MTDKRIDEIKARLAASYKSAANHEHFHGRSGQTAGEMITGFYGDATSDLAFLLSRLESAERVVEAARPLSQFKMVRASDEDKFPGMAELMGFVRELRFRFAAHDADQSKGER
jgi:hypothetical protein